MYFPKVLIIGQPFNKTSGGAITQSNLFSGWDKEKLAVISTGHSLENLNLDVCKKYYQLGIKEYTWKFPFNILQKRFKSGELSFENEILPNPHTIQSNLRSIIVDKYFYPFLKYIGLFHGIISLKISNELEGWLKTVDPDIIYAQASSRESILFLIQLKQLLNKPLVFHMMDDWPSTISSKGLFKNYWHKKIDGEFKELLTTSKLLLGISKAMEIEYKKRYKRQFIPFHNPIKIENWKDYQKKDFTIKENPKLLYAGRTGVGIQDSLKTISQAVNIFNLETKSNLLFIIKSDVVPEWINQFNCVEFQPMESHSKMPEVFNSVDLLILPFDFSDYAVTFTKFSMPTKCTEYMISGTPIIIFAPKETALVSYAKQNNFAAVITQNNPEILAEEIKNILCNIEKRKKISENAIQIASKNHNSKKITQDFRELLISASHN